MVNDAADGQAERPEPPGDRVQVAWQAGAERRGGRASGAAGALPAYDGHERPRATNRHATSDRGHPAGQARSPTRRSRPSRPAASPRACGAGAVGPVAARRSAGPVLAVRGACRVGGAGARRRAGGARTATSVGSRGGRRCRRSRASTCDGWRDGGWCAGARSAGVRVSARRGARRRPCAPLPCQESATYPPSGTFSELAAWRGVGPLSRTSRRTTTATSTRRPAGC